ncbi:MAG: glutathione S-transferase N-terminal domain-containing protein [Cardiobacterium sp.]
MKLYTSTTSPTARAIILTALSQNKDDLQLAYADPWTTPPELTAENPFSQVPTLITDDGIHIYNTLTIADYLFDHPFRGAAQTAVAGYATALLEQIIKAYSLARFQPEGTAEHPHIARARAAVVRGLERAPQLDPASNHIAQHLLAMAYHYAELRHPALYPHLDADNRRAFAEYQMRPDVRAVRPEALEQHPASIAAVRQSIR